MNKAKELLNNSALIYLVLIIMTLLMSIMGVIGATYSYFTTTMDGNDGSVSINSATINGVTFTAESITPIEGILPGWSSGAKTVTVEVENTDYDIPYECTLNVNSNDLNDLYLYVSGDNAYTANNGVKVVSGAMKLTKEGTKLTSSSKSASMTYELKYKETGIDQSSQQGKTLSATVTCSLDGVNHLFYSNGLIGVRAIAYDSDGNPVTVTLSKPDSSLMSEIIADPTTYGLTSEQVSGSKLIGLEVGGTGSRTVKLAVSDIASSGESIKVLHYENNAWTILDDTYLVDDNGDITITLDSFSPFLLANVGVVLEDNTLASLIKSKSVTHADGVYNENGYRYEGSNPNNYITMHNKSTDTDETWRIIGVFPDGVNGEDVIRVRKYYAQDNYPTAAYDINCSGLWIGAEDYCSAYYPESSIYDTLSNIYKTTNYSHTVNYKMYLGTIDSSYGTKLIGDWYTLERGSVAGYYANGETLFSDGAVGLIYPSDYGYAVLASDCARTIYEKQYYSTSTCYTNNWLYQGSSQEQWVITPTQTPEFAFYVWRGIDNSSYMADSSLAYSPVMALDNTVTATGSGTISDPYVISN